MKKITHLKSLTFFMALFCAVNFGFGQTTLAEGDIAITGVNQDGNDQFAFVLLKDVLSGTTINFTDCGWLAIGGFRNYNPISGIIGEGIVTWTAPSDLPCGTQVVIENTVSNTYLASIGTAAETDNGFSISATGDQIIVFQGAIASPTFLYALHFANNTGWTDATGTNSSAVPAGLTEGVNAMSKNFDNCIYNCAVTNNQTLILKALVNPLNWTGSDSVRQALTACAFTCSNPLPCLSTVTWNGAWSGTPDLTTEVIIAANYDTSVGAPQTSFKACSLTVDVGVTLIVSDGTYIEVENDVTIDGTITVQTQGNFVQNDNSGTFTVYGAGISRVNKQTATKAAWFYYTYWSSPVTVETIAGAFPNTDGNRRFWFNAVNYIDADGDDVDDNGDDWTIANGTDTMIPGVGYVATEGPFHIPNSSGIATFTGTFNTGDIPTGVSYNAINTLGSWNLIGNPYPSAIDFIAFQQANSSVIDGAAYFWSQSLPPVSTNPGNEPLNFNQNDYATFTVGTGGAAGANGIVPNQFIPSGQSFFISGLTTGNVTFTNAMRMADGTSNSQFFKGSNSKNKSVNTENKLWVNLTSDNGVFNQILVGYVDGATNGHDGASYDAVRIISQDFAAVLYSSMDENNKKYVIQGKDINSINEDEVIKLGFKTTINVATLYKFSIQQLEGDFLTGNTVYLKDNLLNKLHNLSASDYTFTSEVGEFNARFEIVFNANALSTDDFTSNANTLKIVELDDDQVQFITSNSLSIKRVSVFDLLGRQLYDFKGNNSTETYKLSNLSSMVYIAKVELSNGAVITKKAVKK